MAVMLFNADEELPVLALDFDAKGHSRPQAAKDSQEAVALLTSIGLHPVADVAPTGGWHVYAKLPRPAKARAVRQLATALAARWTTLDITPLCNPIHGCIRPPGSPHTSGGYQALTTPLEAAERALSTIPDPGAWNRLRHAVNAQDYPVPAEAAQTVDDSPAVGTRYRTVSRAADELARTGEHPSRDFQSPSEARFSIIMSCVKAGWSLTGIHAQLGEWPWFEDSLGTKHHTALAGDFRRAKTRHHQDLRERHVQLPDTSQITPRGGSYPGAKTSTANHLPLPANDPYLQLRKFTAFTHDHRKRKHYSPQKRATLDAVILFGHMKARTHTGCGLRSLAEAANNTFQTVGEHVLEFGDDGLMTRVVKGRGTEPDVWAINTELGEDYRPAKGRRQAIRPLFRVLGSHLTAEVYEKLSAERGQIGLTCTQIASRLGYDRRTVKKALTLLAGWNLAAQDKANFTVGTADPEKLSQRLGGHDSLKAHHDEHLAHRQQWTERLERQPQLNAQTHWDTEFSSVEPPEDTWIKDLASGHPPTEQALRLVGSRLGTTTA